MFQAAEDWFVNGFDTVAPSTTFKAALDAEVGSTTLAQAKQVARAWAGWRFKTDP